MRGDGLLTALPASGLQCPFRSDSDFASAILAKLFWTRPSESVSSKGDIQRGVAPPNWKPLSSHFRVGQAGPVSQSVAQSLFISPGPSGHPCKGRAHRGVPEMPRTWRPLSPARPTWSPVPGDRAALSSVLQPWQRDWGLPGGPRDKSERQRPDGSVDRWLTASGLLPCTAEPRAGFGVLAIPQPGLPLTPRRQQHS